MTGSDNDGSKQTPPPPLTGKEEAVVLFTADTNEGRPFYAYIKLTLLKLAEFHEAQSKNAPTDLNRLGEVLKTGWGHEPPQEVHEQIVEEYGDVLSDGD